jgi:acyl-CoA thioester hydrolase/thioesterase-3
MARCYKMPMSEFEREGWGWVVRSAGIEHKRPLALGDSALVRTWVEGIGNPAQGRRARSTCTIGFEIENADTGKLAARGTITYVMIDISSGRPVDIPQHVIERYSI